MCGIFGLIGPRTTGLADDLTRLIIETSERGTDSLGLAVTSAYGKGDVDVGPWSLRYPHGVPNSEELKRDIRDLLAFYPEMTPITIIGNVRAEPTTEWVRDKQDSDTHPFVAYDWMVSHNGVIANDHDLEEQGYKKVWSNIDSAILPHVLEGAIDAMSFAQRLQKLVGSYAILAVNYINDPETVYAATNFKPLYTVKDRVTSTVWFSSSSKYLINAVPPFDNAPQQIAPYTVVRFKGPFVIEQRDLLEDTSTSPPQAIVVCSGGLDSTVVAVQAIKDLGAANVTLLHFKYACRAQVPEVAAVTKLASTLGTGVPCIIDVESLFRQVASTSPLLQEGADIAQGDAGAEYAHEWVPARNLIFLSLATALAENTRTQYVYIGTNLEEAGAYPDNEPEFIHKFNALLPYAVGDGVQVEVRMPVGNLMKYQIVRLGLDLGAPLDQTWSCYNAGEFHCGTCGPCRMRRGAFEMNRVEDGVVYASQVEAT